MIERGALGNSGSDTELTNLARETVGWIDVMAATWRWWLQREAWPRLGLGEQENRERHFKRGEATLEWTIGGGGSMGFDGC